MPMFDLILIFAAALLLAAVGSASRPSIRASLMRSALWMRLVAAACVVSAASALFSTRGHSGTGWRTSFGWPKPYCARWESFEGAEASSGCTLLYFAGNALFYMALLLTAWLVVRWLADARGR